MKHSDYLKKKKTRETRKRIVSVIAAIVVFVTTHALVLPAITLDVSRAGREPGIAFEQMQFKTTASAASVTAADSTEEEVQVEEPAAEEPAEEETVKEEPAESSEEETPAASDTQKEAPAEPEEAEEVEEIEEVPKDQSSAGEADAASSSESDSSEAQNADTQDKQEGADQAGVDQSGAGTKDTADTAATAETAAEFQIPALDALDFDDILTGRTNFYYYHPANAEEAESLSSDTIDDWKKVGSDTVLAPEDFVRVYLSYEIPAGALNETNAEARYRLPACLELSDRQIKAINKYENGIAASKSGNERDRYLGAEAIEGSRTPDETAGDEYISATVKVENTGSGRQDLVFTFIPYTVEKNQITYDEKGQVTSRGQTVKGFFTFDLSTSQIDFEKTGKETVEKEDGTAEEIQYSEVEVVFVEENNDKNIDEISRTLTMAAPAGNEDPQTRGQKSLTSKGSDYTVTVSYTDDAQIPDNAELSVREIEKGTDEYASYLKQAESTVDETKSVNEARFFDITILADGEKVEPRAAVSVQINFTGIEQTDTDDTQLLHYKDDKEVEIMDEAEFSKSEEQAVDTVQFETDGFSVYGIVGTETITTNYITAEGDTYEVTVTYGRDAEIPDKSTLSVAEVTEAAADYESYKKQTADALNGVTDNFQYIKLLDISIINANGEKVIPAAAVDVNIRLLDKSEVSENTQIVHFGEKVEVLESSVEDDAVTFSTEGFSVFVIVDISDLPENNITQTFENDKFIITASYTEKAKIPEDAVLKVSEISYESDPDHYVDRVDQLSGLFSESQYVCKELLNIGFWSNETNTSELLVNGSDSTEIEPADTVLIAIQFKDTAKYSEGDALSIIHFGGEGPELAGESALDEENSLSFEVERFSDFAVVGENREIEYISPISDTAEIHKEGSVTGFLSNLPYGTIYIDYDLMDFSKYSFATSGSSVTGTSTNNPDVSVSIEIKSSNYTAGRGTNGRYGICYSQPTLAAGETVKTEGTFAIITYKNVATLSTGEKANVIVTLSDGYIENTNPNVSQNIGNPVYYGDGLLPSAMSNGFRTAGQFTINIKVTANENDSISGKTFLFGINDYDIGSVVYIKDTYALSSLNGELIGIKIKDGGGSADISGFGRITFPENGVGTYQHASGESHNIRRFFSIPVENEEVIPLYEEDGTTPVLENGEQATAKYKTACYDNTTGEFLFWLLTQDEVISEQTEILNGRLSKIYVSDESTLFAENTSNGAVRLSGTRATGGLETTQEDYDDMMRSGYFVVADAENGLTFRARCSAGANTHLTNSNMIYRIYSRTYEGGTISTSDTDVWGNQTAYGVHQPEGATGDKRYKEALLAVSKNKTAVYTMTPDTFWHIWQVEISDETEDNTSGEIDLRNVTWTDGSYTHHGKNGKDYTFTKDANGVISYTFTGVSEDHYITVWWEKDPPQQTVTIIKKWNDEGNARLSRPDDITVHLVRSDDGRVNPDSDETAKTDLVTGTDQNITGSTQWVKNDTANQWEYTFAVANLPEGSSFKAYEDQVSDYTGDAVGSQNANTATEIGFNEGTNIHQYEVVITNTRKNGTLSFSKTDQYGFPVEGASFRLYNDADCTQPPAAVYTATSDGTGTVTFSDVPCGMYYMKETNIPTYGEGSKPYTDNRHQVYQVVIHENSEDSMITPGTVANHVFTPSGDPVSAIINTKPEGQVTITKNVDGDATAQAQNFVFIMEFPANMAEKTIKINGSDATLGTAVGGKVLYEFTLSHNESITFSALPDDMSYKVEEHEKAEFRTTVSIDPQPSAGTFIIGEEGNDAYVSGKIDADRDYTINYTNKKLKEDENFIIVEKKFEGITRDQIPEDFSVTVTGQGASYTLTKGLNTENIKFSTSEDGLTWKWTIYGAEAGTYTISETNEEVADYVVTTDPADAASQSGHSAQTVAPDFSVTGSQRINSCNNQTFSVEDNFIFIASLTGQGNSGVIVVSQYALSAAQRNAIKDWAQVHGGTGNFLTDDYHFFSTEQQGNEFHVGNATVTYDSQAKTVTFKGTNNWQHVLKGTISKIPGENPDIKITNTYRKKTKEIVITKTDENGNELTGAVFTLTKDSQQVDGSPTDPAVSSTTFNLEYGIYCLSETTAPNGYVILSNKIYFKVDDNGITLQTVSVGNDGKTTYSDANEGDYPLVSLSEDTLTVYVKNTPGQELPNTGGSGTLPYTLGGFALLAFVASMYGFRMRRRERRLN